MCGKADPLQSARSINEMSPCLLRVPPKQKGKIFDVQVEFVKKRKLVVLAFSCLLSQVCEIKEPRIVDGDESQKDLVSWASNKLSEMFFWILGAHILVYNIHFRFHRTR